MKIHVPVLLVSLILSVTVLSHGSPPTLDLTMPDSDPPVPPDDRDPWTWPAEVDPPIVPPDVKLIGVWPPTAFVLWNRQEVQVQIGETREGWRLVACDRESATFFRPGARPLVRELSPR